MRCNRHVIIFKQPHLQLSQWTPQGWNTMSNCQTLSTFFFHYWLQQLKHLGLWFIFLIHVSSKLVPGMQNQVNLSCFQATWVRTKKHIFHFVECRNGQRWKKMNVVWNQTKSKKKSIKKPKSRSNSLPNCQTFICKIWNWFFLLETQLGCDHMTSVDSFHTPLPQKPQPSKNHRQRPKRSLVEHSEEAKTCK